jgi:hypothetical protein
MTPIEIRNMALAHAIAYVEINVRDAGGSSEISDVRDAAREFETFLVGSTALTPAIAATATGTPINPTKLPSRLITLLADSNISTIEQLDAMTDTDISEWRGLGKASKDALIELMASHGLTFGSSATNLPKPGDGPAIPPLESKGEFDADADADEPLPAHLDRSKAGPEGDIFGAEPGPGGVKVITLDDIDKAVRRVVQIGGMPSALALLKPYGVKKLPEVPEDKRAELHAAAEKWVEENSE